MTDPFMTLRVSGDVNRAELARAFADAIRRGVPQATARRSMDLLRDPLTCEAMVLLAPSQTGGYRTIEAGATADPVTHALAFLWTLLGAIVADTERYLASTNVLPLITIHRDVRAYVPPPLEDLDP